MPIHALLGATGSTGGAVLRYLLDEPIEDLELRICVRSRSKLLKRVPGIEEVVAFKITIIEANLYDLPALQRCLDGAELVYCCIATNDSSPTVSVAQDAAKAVTAALRSLKDRHGTSYARPSLLINRSSSLNEELAKHFDISKHVTHFLLFHCYEDIRKACELYQDVSNDEHLLELIRVDPPALHAGGKRTGHKLSLTEPGFRSLNYTDLGAAFVEIGQRRQEYAGEAVIVSADGEVEEHWDVLVRYLLRGLRGRVLGY